MTEYYDDLRAARAFNRERLEPGRMEGTARALRERGAVVEPGPDHKSYRVTFPNGKRFNFWPYTGWFAGPTQGRGFQKLLRAAGIAERRKP